MASYFLRRGSCFHVTAQANVDIHNQLPPGCFIIKEDPRTQELYFDQVDSFKPFKGKVYGATTTHAQRIMRTFGERPNSTGVLLTGEKGSGKTMLARELSIMGEAAGMPTIIVNHDWQGDIFNQLIQSVQQDCIVLFDEFEKVYKKEDQEHILTLLDGVFPSRKLFVLTSNSYNSIDYHMRNRPGRIYYLLDFKGLEQKFIEEYCLDNFKPEYQFHTEAVLKAASLFGQFNFDMMKALVEEINRYGEDPATVMSILNARPEGDDVTAYDIKLTDKNNEKPRSTWPHSHTGNPIRQNKFSVTWYCDSDEDDARNVEFKVTDLIEVTKEGSYVFRNDEGYVIRFIQRPIGGITIQRLLS